MSLAERLEHSWDWQDDPVVVDEVLQDLARVLGLSEGSRHQLSAALTRAAAAQRAGLSGDSVPEDPALRAVCLEVVDRLPHAGVDLAELGVDVAGLRSLLLGDDQADPGTLRLTPAGVDQLTDLLCRLQPETRRRLVMTSQRAAIRAELTFLRRAMEHERRAGDGGLFGPRNQASVRTPDGRETVFTGPDAQRRAQEFLMREVGRGATGNQTRAERGGQPTSWTALVSAALWTLFPLVLLAIGLVHLFG